MNQKVKGLLSFMARMVLSAGLLWWLFVHMDQKEALAELILSADLRYIVLALIPFGIIHYLLLLRWRVLMSALGLRVPWLNLTRYFFLGLFGNLFLPTAIGGDVIKTVGLCANAQDKPKIVASVLLDRLSGYAAVVIVCSLALMAGYRLVSQPVVWIAVGAMALGLSAIGSVLFHEGLYRFFCRVFHFFPKIRDAVIQMHFDIALLKDRKRALITAVGIACLGQGLLAVTFWALAKALHQDVLFFYFLIFTPMTCLASAFPSIGGLGFREGALEYLLIPLGVASGIGVSIGLLDFAFMVFIGVGGWIFFLVTNNQADAVPDEASRGRK